MSVSSLWNIQKVFNTQTYDEKEMSERIYEDDDAKKGL